MFQVQNKEGKYTLLQLQVELGLNFLSTKL